MARRRRRVAPALGLLTLVFATSVPSAQAHDWPVFVRLEEVDGTPVDPGSTMREPRELVIHGASSHDFPPVERVDLVVGAFDPPAGCTVPTYPPVPAGEAADFRRPLLAPDCNGTWTVTATAVLSGDPSAAHPEGDNRSASVQLRVAVPPADPTGVTATATGEDGSEDRAVTVSWSANPEPDLVGYRVDRAVGDEVFDEIAVVAAAESPSFVDDDLPEGGEHRYRVYAVRRGVTAADEDLVTSLGAGEATADVSEPPATTTTTVVEGGSTTTTTDGGSAVTSGGQPRGTTTRPPSGRGRTRTTIDDGFGERLPFDPSRTTTTLVPGGPQEDPADDEDALVELFDDDGDDPRDVLAPVAGSLVLLVGAAHARHLVRRASETEDVITPL
jgi:hypothetical protein